MEELWIKKYIGFGKGKNMRIKNKRALSGIGMASLFATGGAGNLFTALVLIIISGICLYFGKAFDKKTWE